MILDLTTYDGGFEVTVYGPNKGTPVDRTTGHASRPFRSIDRALAWIASVTKGQRNPCANIYAMHPVKKQLWVIEQGKDGLWRFGT